MSRTNATQTTPKEYIPEHWTSAIITHNLQTTKTRPNNLRTETHTQLMEPQVQKHPSEESSIFQTQCAAPKAASRLPNNYTVFKKPITNNTKANSTKQSNENLTGLTENVTTRARIGPKCYMRLHDRFDKEFEIPLVRDDNGDNSLSNNLTTVNEQEQTVIIEVQAEKELAIRATVNELEEVQNISNSLHFVANATDMEIEEVITEHPVQNELIIESDVVSDEMNEAILDPTCSDNPNSKGGSTQAEDNLGQKRRRNYKTVTFEFRDIRTEIVENNENGQRNEQGESNEDEEDEEDKEQDVLIRRRKYIRIFADKVNIYNHFYN